MQFVARDNSTGRRSATEGRRPEAGGWSDVARRSRFAVCGEDQRAHIEQHSSDRSGVTLLELLVVILILLMITAAAIPLIAPALDNRRMREASRLASTFISGARSRAIQTGRETGVQLLRFNGNPYATTLAYVEVPPPYGGRHWSVSTCTVDGSSAQSGARQRVHPATSAPDVVQLGYGVKSYRININ